MYRLVILKTNPLGAGILELIVITGLFTLVNIWGVAAITDHHPYFNGQEYPVPIVEVYEMDGPGSLAEVIQTKLN